MNLEDVRSEIDAIPDIKSVLKASNELFETIYYSLNRAVEIANTTQDCLQVHDHAAQLSSSKTESDPSYRLDTLRERSIRKGLRVAKTFDEALAVLQCTWYNDALTEEVLEKVLDLAETREKILKIPLRRNTALPVLAKELEYLESVPEYLNIFDRARFGGIKEIAFKKVVISRALKKATSFHDRLKIYKKLVGLKVYSFLYHILYKKFLEKYVGPLD